MSGPALATLGARIAALSEEVGRRVEVAGLGVLDRQGQLALAKPGVVSPNGACRLVAAADGWIAVNLARAEDQDLVGAWLRQDPPTEPWAAIMTAAKTRAVDDLIAEAVLLGLPAAAVGETKSLGLSAPVLRMGPGGGRRGGALQVVDLSALWAGPMCGAILAAAGASVIKVEDVRRPDPTAISTPEFGRRLNGAKQTLVLDFGSPEGRARLRALIKAADVLITSARPRAFEGLGLTPQSVFAAHPDLVWVAITGHGWTGPAAARVAFGDDAAAAGGLVRWTAGGAPRFLGDALADPVTGLMAAQGALEGLIAGGGVLVDVALARCAAGAAEARALRAAA
jgi:hypothetical protein